MTNETVFSQLSPDGEIVPVLTYINDNTYLLKGKEITYAQLVYILLGADLDALPKDNPPLDGAEESTITKMNKLHHLQVVPNLKATTEEWDTSTKPLKDWLEQADRFGCFWAKKALELMNESMKETEVVNLDEALLCAFSWSETGNHNYWNAIHNILVGEGY